MNQDSDLQRQLDALRESEEMYRSFIERSNDGVVVLQDTLVRFANRRFVEMSGYPPEKLLDVPFTDHLPPEEVEFLLKRYEQRMAGIPIPPIYETAMTRADGVKLPLEISAALITFRGRPADLVLVRDITERRQAEEYLNRYKLLSESTRDILVFIEPGGKIMEANRAATEAYHYSRDELLSLNARCLRTEEERDSFPELVERALREPILYETTHRRKDGSTFPVEIGLSAAVIGSKQVLLGVIRDITERKRTQAILDEERERLNSALEALETSLEETRRESWRASALEGIAEAGLSILRLPELLHNLVERIAHALNVDASCVFVLDEEAGEFEAHAAYNVPGLVGCRIKMNEGLVGKVAEERRPIYIADTERDALTVDTCEMHSDARTLLGFPLIARGRIVGVARVQSLVRREFSEDEVRLMQAIGDRVAVAIDNAQLYRALQASRTDLEEALGREKHFSLLLQQALLPAEPSIGEDYSVAVKYVPSYIGREIGGDFYDVFGAGNGWTGILIGDVSGKGLEAASLAATTRSTVHAFVHETQSPGEVLTRANSVLLSQQPTSESFVTVALITLDPPTGDICCASAGHPPAAILRADGSVEFLPLGELPLGVSSYCVYSEQPDHLGPGDTLLLYTDGISEAHVESELFDIEGIQRTIVGRSYWSADEIADRLISAATEWAQGKLRDDAAIVVVRRSR